MSVWYVQLAQQLEAGVSIAEAFRATAGTEVPARDVLRMAELCERGHSVDEAFSVSSRWIPEPDRLFLSAAAETGRLPRVLRNLSDRHAQLGTTIARLAFACAYPLAVLHLGLLLFPLRSMIDWETGFAWSTASYLRSIFATAGPLWLLVGVIIVLVRRQSPLLYSLARGLPVFRSLVRNQALADFAFALANFLEAGLRIDHAWQAASVITRSSKLKSAAQAIDGAIARGEQPGSHLKNWHCFPPEFVALYQSGETTGQLEQNLFRLTARYQEEANQRLNQASFLYPGVLFLTIVVLIGYHVVSFFAGYLQMLNELSSG